jgi:hypothetical protein
MFGTVITYMLIFLSIQAKSRRMGNSAFPNSDGSTPAAMKRAAKYMIIYPLVYVVCTLPLAGGRMAAMTGVKIPYCEYFDLMVFPGYRADYYRVVLPRRLSHHILWLVGRPAVCRNSPCFDLHQCTSATTRYGLRHIWLEEFPRTRILGHQNNHRRTLGRSLYSPQRQARLPGTEDSAAVITKLRRGAFCRARCDHSQDHG